MVRLSDFDYELPEELIAQTPLADRAASRLLHVDPESGEVTHRQFRDVVDILREGDVLVLNNTRVNAWRFKGQKPTGGEIEILALKEISFGVFEALIKPAKRLKPGATFYLGLDVTGTVLEGGHEPTRIVQLACETGDLHSKLAQIGDMPLPPYITEKLDDWERYQTV
ncbi:MAG: S-adenosylmethionine:tRNA ribosyltransferase-isomerase, partial [Armatimonadota bacterium]